MTKPRPPTALAFILVGLFACGTPWAPPALDPTDAAEAGDDQAPPADATAEAGDGGAAVDVPGWTDADVGGFDRDPISDASDLGCEAGPCEPPSFDCDQCVRAGTNRSCVDQATACGCTHDRHCRGSERCAPETRRCVACELPDCWRSALYPADWTPARTDTEGRFLHDFSYAGYGAGLEAIPSRAGPTFDVTDFGAGPDWRAAMQSAIDAAASAGGGIVFIPAGNHRVDGRLVVSGSNVVLRGAGVGISRVHFSTAAGMSDRAHLELGSDPGYGAELLFLDDAPSRTSVVEVDDASALQLGDRVALGWVVSEAFRAEHGMSAYWGFAAGQWRPFFRRTVVSIDTSSAGRHRVELDVPLRYRARVRDHASLRRIEGIIHGVGVEDLSLSNAVDQSSARAENRASLIALRGVEDGWVRRVETFVSPLATPVSGHFHVQSHGISIINARRVTVEDVSIGRAQNRGSGGNGYLIELSRSNEVLVQRVRLRDGRHNFSFNWDFGNSGIVIRESDSQGSTCDGAFVSCKNEFHHALAMAVLVENTRIADAWVGGNRRQESSGAGHTVTESVYWRLHGSEKLYSWQFGHGYLIGNDIEEQVTEVADTTAAGWELEWYPFWALESNGHTSIHTEPEDWTEGVGARSHLVPPSLYLDQLERRTAVD